MNIEQKWDLVWPAVCAVVAESKSHAACRSDLARYEALNRLLGHCRELENVAERIVTSPVFSNPDNASLDCDDMAAAYDAQSRRDSGRG